MIVFCFGKALHRYCDGWFQAILFSDLGLGVVLSYFLALPAPLNIDTRDAKDEAVSQQQGY